MTTQNDWAERFDKFFCTASGGSLQLKGCFDLSVGSCVEVMPQIKAFIAKELADARREVINKVEKMKKNGWDLSKIDYGFIDQGYNQAIDDVLATLREEEK